MDYSNQNLRGRSFKGQNLANANFSDADIRGTNFTGAILTGANFSRSKAGLQKRQVIFLMLVSCIITGVSGFFFALNHYFASEIFGNLNLFNLVAACTVITVLIICFFVTLPQGMNIALRVFVLAIVFSGALTFARALVIGLFVTLAIAGALTLGGTFTGALAFSFAIAGALAGEQTGILGVAFAGALTGNVVSAYIALRAIKRDQNFFRKNLYCWTLVFIRNFAVAFAAFGGTSFRNADLTDANFTLAHLNHTDFRNANLTRTCFRKVKKLDFARPGNTYLKSFQLLQVLVTGNGREKNFDREDLRGVNLQGADLVGGSFISADLSQANLQDSDLSRAKLAQTQLDATDFTGAKLTGSFIEDWNITTDTNFRGVRCEYMYMRLPTKDNPEPLRKPDNREEVFEDGEFGDFIKPIVDTLDLYHNQGVDPRAIAIAFKELADNNPDADLEIVAMEKRGYDKFLLRTKTATEVNKSELSQQYFHSYNHLKTLSPPEQVQYYLNQISVKDKEIEGQQRQIASLENMVVTALGNGNIQNNYRNTYKLNEPKFGGNLNDCSTNNFSVHQTDNNLEKNKELSNNLENKDTNIKTILVLSANPKNTSSLRLDEEVREIDAGLRRARRREQFNLQFRLAVRIRDVAEALLDFQPQIVHFCGHGGGDDGLALEDETGNLQYVSTKALTGLFELFSQGNNYSNPIECIVLNACYSEVQATAISEHIPYVIGMNKAIGDKAAIEFAVGFYSALAAGESIDFAYRLGCHSIAMSGIAEELTPILKKT